MMGYHIGPDGQPISLSEWAELYFDPAVKTVAVDTLWWRKGKALTVSTTYLGINHNFTGTGPPIIYETMIFPGEDCWRYATRGEAAAGHEGVARGVTRELVRRGFTVVRHREVAA